MIFFCDSCQEEKNFETELVAWRAGEKRLLRFCRSCRDVRVSVPDVYWDGKPEENLANDPATGQPRAFLSKGQKAAYLRERGIMEAGDRVHGAPVMAHKNQDRKVDTKHEAQMALKQVREMGQDARRREYLRTTKEGQHHA